MVHNYGSTSAKTNELLVKICETFDADDTSPEELEFRTRLKEAGPAPQDLGLKGSEMTLLDFSFVRECKSNDFNF